MALLRADRINVSYHRDIDILKEVSVRVSKGTVTAVIGPNGAGKSTLLKTFYGILKPNRGEVYLKEERLTDLRVHQFIQRGIAYVPQLRSLFPDLTVQENLELGTWIFRRDKNRVREAIERVFSRFPALSEKRRQPAGLLSGGQQKMLEIARCLLTEPEVCLLDEPTATLAPKIAKDIYRLLVELKEEGMTFLVVDQRVKQIFEIADYIYVLELGRNKIEGTREAFEGGLKEVIKGWLD